MGSACTSYKMPDGSDLKEDGSTQAHGLRGHSSSRITAEMALGGNGSVDVVGKYSNTFSTWSLARKQRYKPKPRVDITFKVPLLVTFFYDPGPTSQRLQSFCISTTSGQAFKTRPMRTT